LSLGSWLNSAANISRKSEKNKGWLAEIIAYFDNRTTSGVVEGINNKLKLILVLLMDLEFFNFRVRCLLTWHFSISLA